MAERKNTNDIMPISPDSIKNLIYTIRGKQVMIDSDLAMLYGVTTGNLNKAMKRNEDRFSDDFCFELTKDEYKNLMFQNGISSSENNYGGRRTSVAIIRAFVEMRKFLLNNHDLFARLDKVEFRQIAYQKSTDEKFEKVFDYIAEKNEVSQKIFFDDQIYDVR